MELQEGKSQQSGEHISMTISDEDCDDISINRTGDLFEHRLPRWAQCVPYLCIRTSMCVCICSLVNFESYLILSSSTEQIDKHNWKMGPLWWSLPMQCPQALVVPCAHPLAAQCNVRFVLSSFNPRTMPSPFPCRIELKPVETVKSPRAKFKCKGPRRNDKPKKTEKKTNECNKRNWGQGLTRRCREEVEWEGSGVTCAAMSFLSLQGIPLWFS